MRREISSPLQDDNPALFDWGTFVNGGTPDPTWVRTRPKPRTVTQHTAHCNLARHLRCTEPGPG